MSNFSINNLNRQVTIAILGLDNAGKTTTSKRIRGAPTVGFDRIEFSIFNYNVLLYDIGGGSNIRQIWKSYFAEIYGLIYVIDASDENRLEECKNVLLSIFSDPRISGKPILLLANKQDIPSAISEAEIIEALSIDYLANHYRCPCRIECCSALTGKRLDKSIEQGLKWLLKFIELERISLNVKIEEDMKVQAEENEKERLERKIRVQKARELRSKEEGIQENVDNAEVGVNPSFDINVNELEVVPVKSVSNDQRLHEAIELSTIMTKPTSKEECDVGKFEQVNSASGDGNNSKQNNTKRGPSGVRLRFRSNKTHPAA